MTSFTYAPVGRTREGAEPAPGYRHLRYQAILGHGEAEFVRAAEALMSWRGHAALWMRPRASAPRAEEGATIVCRLGPITIPCRVVWTLREKRRAGFGYGTLPGHPAKGEEAFLVELGDDGAVRFTVTSYSLPASWYAKAAGPVTVLLQRAFARLYAQAMRRMARTD
ncbi:uncharacterized protein (UPF0548 family) [Thermocatellispora tengchongensis]|uniref:Uncharacterized protein (UPF0548 family) n=1 Tax=Thermocatellispora tengchongensis TaxID=1073253 RepID=A0A840P8Y6_9ACTN|nr:DUF1990 domain-containing protein [Thermocatellispora tengchongensis]MBB5135086.1 uncharacterized protein (UPF0548 family) [Thermocatellispora tengchongensis]